MSNPMIEQIRDCLSILAMLQEVEMDGRVKEQVRHIVEEYLKAMLPR